jgi:Tol biopolymer transport system component
MSKRYLFCLMVLLMTGCATRNEQPKPEQLSATEQPEQLTSTPVITKTQFPATTVAPTISPSPTITPTPTETFVPTPTQFAGGGKISVWDFSNQTPLLLRMNSDGSEVKQVFSFDEIEGDYSIFDVGSIFSMDGRFLLFPAVDKSNGAFTYFLLDTGDKTVRPVHSFPFKTLVPVNANFYLNRDVLLFTIRDSQSSDDLNSQFAKIVMIDLAADNNLIDLPNVGKSTFLEGVLPDGSLLVSKKRDDGQFDRVIIELNGEEVKSLDIDGQIEDILDRSISNRPYLWNAITDREGSTPPKVNGKYLYLKECAETSEFYTCSLFQVDLSESSVKEIINLPGESIFSFDVSSDNMKVAYRHCKYLDLLGNVNKCNLGLLDLQTEEILFEIPNGEKPVWSPDGRYFVYIDEIIENFYVQSSTLMRSSWDGSEIIEILPGNDKVNNPDWSE